MDDMELVSQLEALRIVMLSGRSALDMLAALGNQAWYEQGELDAFLNPVQAPRRAVA
jgi:hypothetical protein